MGFGKLCSIQCVQFFFWGGGGGGGVLGMFATLQRSTNHRFAKTNKSPPETFLSSAVVGMGPLDGRCLF